MANHCLQQYVFHSGCKQNAMKCCWIIVLHNQLDFVDLLYWNTQRKKTEHVLNEKPIINQIKELEGINVSWSRDKVNSIKFNWFMAILNRKN